MSFVVSNREKSNFLWNSISGLLQRMLSIKVDDNAEALESEALCFLFQRWWHIYDFLLSISEFRSHQASSYTENVYLVKRSEMAFRRMYFGIPEWTRTISIWSLIHYFFSLQQSWHTQDHQIKKKQPGTMRIDILASILFFEVVWISTHDPNFRVIHFFFFVSFSEVLSHVELI